MKKYIFDQSNGLWYALQGNYYIPCLVLDEAGTSSIGMWGQKAPAIPERASTYALFESHSQRKIAQLSGWH